MLPVEPGALTRARTLTPTLTLTLTLTRTLTPTLTLTRCSLWGSWTVFVVALIFLVEPRPSHWLARLGEIEHSVG